MKGCDFMKSAIAITYELDDISAATTELVAQIREKLVLDKQSIGILYGQPDMEIGELSANLSEELGFSIVGGTTGCGGLLSTEGYHDLAVILHVMTASDCLFSVSISPALDTDLKQGIVDTYKDALSKLQMKDESASPKMVFCIAPLLANYSSDSCVEILSEIAAGLPVFGFIAADDFDYCKQQVYVNEKCYGDRIALLLISGNIHPIFEVRNLAGSRTLSKRRVTKSHDNIIYEIDDKPAYEYLTEFPFINKDSGTLFNYQFFTEMVNEEDNDGVSISRVLHTYDKATGEIVCFANVPQGSYIGLLCCDGEDVKETSQKAFESLAEKITIEKQKGYEYSSVFIANCTIRNMFLADNKEVDGDLISKTIPSNLVTSGLYAYGEIAPTSIRNGKAVNRFHNATITFCAI